MNLKMLAATGAFAAALGIGVLAGSVLSPSANASVPVTQVSQPAQAQANPTSAPDTQKPGAPVDGQQKPGRGGRGFGGGHGPGDFNGFGGPGGPGGPGGGPHGDHFGGAYTADGATRAISGTTGMLDLVKGDLTYATGKMDTATAQGWVNNADSLLAAAKTANSNGEYGKAVETAGAARELAGAAELVLQQALGADTLPSYTQRQGKGLGHIGGPGAQSTANVTQAQASRVLARLYDSITVQQALVNAAANKGDAATYLAAAKDQYSKAYTAYQAGTYSEAVNAANVGQALLQVAHSLLEAGTAPSSPDTPVTVPAPFV